MRHWLVLRAFLELLRCERHLRSRNFAALHEKVRRCSGRESKKPNLPESVCHAVDLACIWYFKEVECLQRSVVTARLLRSSGIPASLVIGVRHVPFKAHAWVEVDGRVVNDKPYVNELYAVLDRC
jgi:hypothetical protein